MTDAHGENPYSPPGAELADGESEGATALSERAKVVAAAEGQRQAVILFLAGIGILFVGRFAGSLFDIIALLVQIGFVYIIARTFYRIAGVGMAIIWGVCACLPILSLLALIALTVNTYRMVTAAGFAFGPLGANVESIRAWSVGD